MLIASAAWSQRVSVRVIKRWGSRVDRSHPRSADRIQAKSSARPGHQCSWSNQRQAPNGFFHSLMRTILEVNRPNRASAHSCRGHIGCSNRSISKPVRHLILTLTIELAMEVHVNTVVPCQRQLFNRHAIIHSTEIVLVLLKRIQQPTRLGC